MVLKNRFPYPARLPVRRGRDLRQRSVVWIRCIVGIAPKQRARHVVVGFLQAQLRDVVSSHGVQGGVRGDVAARGEVAEGLAVWWEGGWVVGWAVAGVGGRFPL